MKVEVWMVNDEGGGGTEMSYNQLNIESLRASVTLPVWVAI